jgi:hypothetical protein
MNPFTQDVINTTLPLMDQSLAAQQNQSADSAVKTGAFGGSRFGVQQAVNDAQTNLLKGQLGAQLNSANFAQAQAGATGDINRNLQAQGMNQQASANDLTRWLQGQMANQQAGLMANQQHLSAAQQLGNLAGQSQQSLLGGLSAGLAGQGQLQQNQQDQLNALMQQYTEQRQQPIDSLRVAMSALGGVPYGQNQTQTQTGPGPSSSGLMQGLGAAGTGIGILGSLGSLFTTGPPLAGLVGSDRDLKTDIKKIGKDKETDLPLYSYRYKGDPKTYPKVVGPMAQDIQKKYPDQVKDVGGHLAVNLGFGPMRKAFH